MSWHPTRRAFIPVGGWRDFIRFIGATVETNEETGEEGLTGIEGWAFEAVTHLQYGIPMGKDYTILGHELRLAIVWDFAQRNMVNLEAVEHVATCIHGMQDTSAIAEATAALKALGCYPTTIPELALALRRA